MIIRYNYNLFISICCFSENLISHGENAVVSISSGVRGRGGLRRRQEEG